jgi:hypothetical protein
MYPWGSSTTAFSSSPIPSISIRVLLVAERYVRVLSGEGEILRRLVLDPGRKYQPCG